MDVHALVVEAVGPARSLGVWRKCGIDLAYRDPAGVLRRARQTPRLRPEQWLVPGMTVFATVDGDQAEIDFDRIPPLADRIAASDPPLCRLETTMREVSVARRELLETETAAAQLAPEMRLAPDLLAELVRRDQATYEADLAALLAARPAHDVIDSDGRLRGTADFVAREQQPPRDPSESSGGPPLYKGRRLYRVWLYGRDPYPVADEVWFNKPLNPDRALLLAGEVPVSVDPSDRDDVRFLWDEYDRDPVEVLHQRALKQTQRAGHEAAYLAEKMLESTFAAIPDVAQRRALAEQMRAQGTTVPDHLLRDHERIAKLDTLLARGVISRDEYDQQVARL